MRPIMSSGLLAAFLLLASPLHAQNVTGTWEITTSTLRGERTITVTLVQEGATVTGTAQMAMMGRRGGGAGQNVPREVPISDGSFQDGTLTFTVTMGRGDRTFSQTYVATTVTDEAMEGTITGEMRSNEPLPFKGVKKED